MTDQEVIRILSLSSGKLSQLVRQMGDQRLELGDDLRIVDMLEHDLSTITALLTRLRSEFDLSVVPLSHANLYFNAMLHLEEALRLMHTIRRRDYGSQQHTRQCYTTLSKCSKSVQQISSYLLMVPQSVHA